MIFIFKSQDGFFDPESWLFAFCCFLHIRSDIFALRKAAVRSEKSDRNTKNNLFCIFVRFEQNADDFLHSIGILPRIR